MRGLINDCLRRLIGLSIKGLGLALAVRQIILITTWGWNQKRLRRRYGITPDTPILTFGSELEQLIEQAALQAGPGARFAFTSGSTAKRKRILYTKGRLRAVRIAYIDFFARCCWSKGIARTSLYVFSSVANDDSLTSMLLEESDLPPYLSSLQAPYRVHRHQAVQSMVTQYGATAVRLWILAISNPGVLYSTNPSTLSIFLDELAAEWPRSSKLIKDWCGKPDAFPDEVRRIARRLESRGSTHRLGNIAKSQAALPLQVCASAVEVYVCWSGGYVKPFLDRLANHLPADRYRLIPMYSMSTETLETVGHFEGHTLSFLPLASQVLYEFIQEGLEDHPQKLRTASQLEAGKTYSLVVSDPFGLRRYQTGDLFICNALVAGLPDLRFMRRRDLEYSFTGEKLTSEQVMRAFETLREEYDLGGDTFLTCVPSQPADEPIPHYKIVLFKSVGARGDYSDDQLAKRCDELFSEVNGEYKSKHESGRLGQLRFISLTRSEFINEIAGRHQSHAWESQFKFLPLYRRTWESLTGVRVLSKGTPEENQKSENPGPG
jgi:hypothetical protein